MYFERVWKIRQSHMVQNLPVQYSFFLICCLDLHCTHPVCEKGELSELPKRYDGGPSISTFPLPIPDSQRFWGNTSCVECKGQCTGHYLKPQEAVSSTQTPLKPPSIILKESFDTIETYPPEDSLYQQLAEKTLLKIEEVKIWFEHLHTIKQNRKKGAAKAAETRRMKARASKEIGNKAKRNNEYYCGVCHEPYIEFTETEEKWIECDGCDTWFHFLCLGISVAPNEFLCNECKEH